MDAWRPEAWSVEPQQMASTTTQLILATPTDDDVVVVGDDDDAPEVVDRLQGGGAPYAARAASFQVDRTSSSSSPGIAGTRLDPGSTPMKPSPLLHRILRPLPLQWSSDGGGRFPAGSDVPWTASFDGGSFRFRTCPRIVGAAPSNSPSRAGLGAGVAWWNSHWMRDCAATNSANVECSLCNTETDPWWTGKSRSESSPSPANFESPLQSGRCKNMAVSDRCTCYVLVSAFRTLDSTWLQQLTDATDLALLRDSGQSQYPQVDPKIIDKSI